MWNGGVSKSARPLSGSASILAGINRSVTPGGAGAPPDRSITSALRSWRELACPPRLNVACSATSLIVAILEHGTQ
jgi:hypothetical protein